MSTATHWYVHLSHYDMCAIAVSIPAMTKSAQPWGCLQPAANLSGREEAEHEERPLLGFVDNPHRMHGHHNSGSHRCNERHHH